MLERLTTLIPGLAAGRAGERMIVTLTPNPAVDQTVWIDRLETGAVNRPLRAELDPAGKGVNVSRMVHRLGWPTIAFGFAGGETGGIIERSLDEEGVQHHFVKIAELTRVNTTIIEESGRATSLYGPGPRVTAEQQSALAGLIRFWLQAGRAVLVIAGSLPPGMPESAVADHIHDAHQLGARVILDADDEVLRLGVAAGPELIKPNLKEAERLLGHSIPDQRAALQAARDLVQRGVGTVVLSLGAQGSICVSGERAWRALPPRVDRRSSVGSGDSMVAALAVSMARGEPASEGLRLGTAAGAATAMMSGTSRGTLAQVQLLLPEVQLEELS